MSAQLKTINKQIKDKGIDAELVKGDGYFYFIGSAVSQATSTSVYVAKLNQLTPEKWIKELEHIITKGY